MTVEDAHLGRGLEDAFSAAAFEDEEVQQKLDTWRQGDLVANVGLFWAGTEAFDPITGVSAGCSAGHVLPVIPWDGQSATGDTPSIYTPVQPWSIVTTQTCDVSAVGPGARHPFVQVSPLVNIATFQPNVIRSIKQGQRVDMVLVDAVPGDGIWAADLRVSLPLSKAVLLAQSPIRGFSNEALALEFSESVAMKYRRPAFADPIADGFRSRLNNFVEKEAGALAPWVEEVEQFRLVVLEGSRLEPREVALYVVTLSNLSTEAACPLRKWRNLEKKKLKKDGIDLARLRFRNIHNMFAAEYRTASVLAIPALSRHPWW